MYLRNHLPSSALRTRLQGGFEERRRPWFGVASLFRGFCFGLVLGAASVSVAQELTLDLRFHGERITDMGNTKARTVSTGE